MNDTAALASALTALAQDRPRLAALMGQAARDGAPFNDVAVFKHRSEVMRAHLGTDGPARAPHPAP